MDRIKKVFSLIHLSGWLLAFLFFCWVFASEGHQNWLFITGAGLAISSTIFYSHFFLLTRYLNRKKYGLYLAGLVMVLLLGPFPFLGIQGRDLSDWPTFLDQYFTTLLSLVLLCVLFSTIARLIENWFLNTFKREALEKQAIQAELTYLKSQINPHFLFNTLNNIHTLAYKQSPDTQDAIMRLASLMRYMIYESNANTVALSKEISYLRDFIDLQQLRYKADSVVDLTIAGDPDTCQVAPLLFIHLLENAYKHSRPLLAGDIRVRIEVKEKSLWFDIQNPVGSTQPRDVDEPGGIGLSNVQKRLQLLYPGRHSFDVTSAEGFFRVSLKIDCLQLPHHAGKADMLYSG